MRGLFSTLVTSLHEKGLISTSFSQRSVIVSILVLFFKGGFSVVLEGVTLKKFFLGANPQTPISFPLLSCFNIECFRLELCLFISTTVVVGLLYIMDKQSLQASLSKTHVVYCFYYLGAHTKFRERISAVDMT